MDRHRWLVAWNACAISHTEEAVQEPVAALLGCGYAVGLVEPT